MNVEADMQIATASDTDVFYGQRISRGWRFVLSSLAMKIKIAGAHGLLTCAAVNDTLPDRDE